MYLQRVHADAAAVARYFPQKFWSLREREGVGRPRPETALLSLGENLNPPSLLGAKMYGTRCDELEIRNCGTYENGPSTLTPQMRYKRLQDPPLAQVKRRYSGGWWLVQSNVKAKAVSWFFCVLWRLAPWAGRGLVERFSKVGP